ncbi:MAG: hypothetical protein U0T73_11115 [Chitinophagales bacterium]
MHDIEPHFTWRDYYIASNDKQSPFYRRKYNEFAYENQVYNYYIHPQWDDMGSATLFCKILYVNYEKQFAVIELIGEWNDAINNDIMQFRKEVIDPMMESGIFKFVLIGENVLNFHASDDCYYEDWYENIRDQDGWIIALNFRDHVVKEMQQGRIHHYINMGPNYNHLEWRKVKPFYFHKMAEELLFPELE